MWKIREKMHTLGKYDGERSQRTSVLIVSADNKKIDKIKNSNDVNRWIQRTLRDGC